MFDNNKKLDRPKFTIGELVKHRYYPFRGVIFDVDPEFMNSEEWYDSIPKDIRPKRNQPFYKNFRKPNVIAKGVKSAITSE